MCKISVIVPCYGVEAYLDRCMSSLLTQTLDDIEIIMVDDGSPDRVPFMCDEYAKKDSRIKIVHKENGGLGYARNSGLDLATGEYVVFIDSDDYIESDAFEMLYYEATKNQADAVFSGFYIQNKQGLWEEHIEMPESKEIVGAEIEEFKLGMIASAPYEKVERSFWVSVWHALYKRSLIEKHHIRFVSEREYAAEDIPFQVQFLSYAKKISYLPKCFYHYCINGTSLTHSFNIDKFLKLKNMGKLLKSLTNGNAEASLRINRFLISDARMHFLRLVQSDNKDKTTLMKKMMNDDLWVDVKAYKPSYFPLYQRFFYLLILRKQTYLLFVYSKFINFLKQIIIR